jgi:hypothetical protein
MDFEERLDRIAQRHEALALTVELIGHMQAENERAWGKLAKAQEKNEVMMAQLMESVGSLARIAHIHEQRITNLEDRRQ